MKNFEVVERWGKYANMIYEDVLSNDWTLEDWSNKNEYDEYEENSYIPDDNDFIEIVKISLDIKKRIEDKEIELYDRLLQLSDNHTIFELNPKEDIDMETYWMHARDKFDAFEKETGVELFGEGRSSRHICVHNTLENACRYDELQEVQKRLERELINEFN